MPRTTYQPHAGFSHSLRAVAAIFCLAGATYCWRQVWGMAQRQQTALQLPWLSDSRPLIVVDAGHGGMDGGTQGGGVLEKTLALDTSLLLARALQVKGYRVALTRESDVAVPLDQRAALANEKRAAAFVSIHFDNAGKPGSKAAGFEVLFTEEKSDSAKQALSTRLQVNPEDPAVRQASINLGTSINTAILTRLRIPSRGVRPQNLAVCRLTDCPAVLVEGGFLSSERDLQRLRDPKHRQEMAEAIAQGVDLYFAGGGR
jgi:N-acetylmuramoyl-L-alanine amidase